MSLEQCIEKIIQDKGASILTEDDFFGEDALDMLGARAYKFDELKTERYRSEPLDRLLTMYKYRQNQYRPTFVDQSYRDFETNIENGLFLDHCAIMGTPQQMVWMMETGEGEGLEDLISGLRDFTEDNEFYLDGSDIKPDYNNVEIFAPNVVWDLVDEALGSGKAIMYPSNLNETMRRNNVPEYVVTEVSDIMSKVGESVELEDYWVKEEDGAIARAANDHGLTVVSVDKDFPLGKKGRRTDSKKVREEIYRTQPDIVNPLSIDSLTLQDERSKDDAKTLLDINTQTLKETLRLLDSEVT